MQNTIDPEKRNYVYRFIYLVFCIDFIVVYFTGMYKYLSIGDSLQKS